VFQNGSAPARADTAALSRRLDPTRIDFQSPVAGARNVVAGNTDLTMSRSDGARALRPVRPAQPDWPDGGHLANEAANVCRTLPAATRMVQRWNLRSARCHDRPRRQCGHHPCGEASVPAPAASFSRVPPSRPRASAGSRERRGTASEIKTRGKKKPRTRPGLKCANEPPGR